jgi:hypothetical protein
MPTIDETIWCYGCGVEISWAPLVVDKCRYCCRDCHEGLPCRCGERMELEDERRNVRATSPEVPGGYVT